MHWSGIWSAIVSADSSRVGLLAASSIACPKCHEMFAWLGDHGASITLYGACLLCAKTLTGVPLIELTKYTHGGPLLRAVVELREGRERAVGRRVFPCIAHTKPLCTRCGGRGWILGFPPSVLPS